MSDLLQLLGAIQSGGGLMIVGVIAAARLVTLERDFLAHRHHKDGEIYIEKGKGQ